MKSLTQRKKIRYRDEYTRTIYSPTDKRRKAVTLKKIVYSDGRTYTKKIFHRGYTAARLKYEMEMDTATSRLLLG